MDYCELSSWHKTQRLKIGSSQTDEDIKWLERNFKSVFLIKKTKLGNSRSCFSTVPFVVDMTAPKMNPTKKQPCVLCAGVRACARAQFEQLCLAHSHWVDFWGSHVNDEWNSREAWPWVSKFVFLSEMRFYSFTSISSYLHLPESLHFQIYGFFCQLDSLQCPSWIS